MTKTKKLKKTYLIIIVAAVVVLILGAYSFIKNKNSEITLKPQTTNDINFSPPTEQEIKDTEDHKASLNDTSTISQDTNSNGKKVVNPIITYAGVYGSNIEIGSYISEVIENDGVCTLTLAKGSEKITKKTNGVANASNTSCPTFIIDKKEITNGTWIAKIFYSSTNYEGSSNDKSFEIN